MWWWCLPRLLLLLLLLSRPLLLLVVRGVQSLREGRVGMCPCPAGGLVGRTGAITGVRTKRVSAPLVRAYSVAVGGAVVTVAAGVATYNYGPHALDWALEGKDCYRAGMDDYHEVLQEAYGEHISLIQPLEWRKRVEVVRACGTGTRPHQEQAEQARADRLAREIIKDMLSRAKEVGCAIRPRKRRKRKNERKRPDRKTKPGESAATGGAFRAGAARRRRRGHQRLSP